MYKDPNVAPVLLWAGGKRQLLDAYTALLPETITTYYEPFLGGGAVLFHIQPESAHVSDINPELTCVYRVIKNNVEDLITELSKFENTPEQFYEVRSWDRDKAYYAKLTEVQKAARVLYLNKTCFNGLYRVNRKGEFNVSFGKRKNPGIVNALGLRAVSKYFNSSDIHISTRDYQQALAEIPDDAFVYLDPPYDQVSKTSNFTRYTREGFTREDQFQLKECCDALTARGIKFMLSNSATDFVLNLYAGYNITRVPSLRYINSKGSKRGRVDEVVIRNYE